MVQYKYKLEVYFVSEEQYAQPEDVLEGSWLYDTDFRGAVSSAKLMRR
jgi:hypothetical protein